MSVIQIPLVPRMRLTFSGPGEMLLPDVDLTPPSRSACSGAVIVRLYSIAGGGPGSALVFCVGRTGEVSDGLPIRRVLAEVMFPTQTSDAPALHAQKLGALDVPLPARVSVGFRFRTGRIAEACEVDLEATLALRS